MRFLAYGGAYMHAMRTLASWATAVLGTPPSSSVGKGEGGGEGEGRGPVACAAQVDHGFDHGLTLG